MEEKTVQEEVIPKILFISVIALLISFFSWVFISAWIGSRDLFFPKTPLFLFFIYSLYTGGALWSIALISREEKRGSNCCIGIGLFILTFYSFFYTINTTSTQFLSGLFITGLLSYWSTLYVFYNKTILDYWNSRDPITLNKKSNFYITSGLISVISAIIWIMVFEEEKWTVTVLLFVVAFAFFLRGQKLYSLQQEVCT